MLWNTLDTEGLVLTSNSVHQVVVWDSNRSSGSSNVRQIWDQSLSLIEPAVLTLEGNSLLDRIDLLSLGFVDGDLSLFVSGNVSCRLDNRPGLESADGDGRQKRGEEEVVSGGHDNDVKLFSVEVLQERSGTPSGTKHDQGGLGRIIVELLSWVDILLGHCGYQPRVCITATTGGNLFDFRQRYVPVSEKKLGRELGTNLP